MVNIGPTTDTKRVEVNAQEIAFQIPSKGGLLAQFVSGVSSLFSIEWIVALFLGSKDSLIAELSRGKPDLKEKLQKLSRADLKLLKAQLTMYLNDPGQVSLPSGELQSLFNELPSALERQYATESKEELITNLSAGDAARQEKLTELNENTLHALKIYRNTLIDLAGTPYVEHCLPSLPPQSQKLFESLPSVHVARKLYFTRKRAAKLKDTPLNQRATISGPLGPVSIEQTKDSITFTISYKGKKLEYQIKGEDLGDNIDFYEAAWAAHREFVRVHL